MNANLIKKYYDIILYLNETKNKTNDEKLKEYCTSSLENLLNDLYKLEKGNKEQYKELFIKFNLNINNFVDSLANENIFIKYEQELENIFKNPNEESIKVWLNNIEDFAKMNNIKNDELISFVNNMFVKLDKENKYDKLIQGYLSKYNINNKTEDSNLDNKSDGLKEEPHEKNINENNTKENAIKEEQIKPLKIKSMKKSFNSKIKNKALTISALASLVAFKINPLFGIAVGVGSYYVYKNGIKEAKKLIVKNGYQLNNNDELMDNSGRIITTEDIGKLKYSLVRNELSNIKDGKIDKNYKKNRLTHLLLNNNLVKGIKNKFKTIGNDNYESPQLVKDINKGMRKV